MAQLMIISELCGCLWSFWQTPVECEVAKAWVDMLQIEMQLMHGVDDAYRLADERGRLISLVSPKLREVATLFGRREGEELKREFILKNLTHHLIKCLLSSGGDVPYHFGQLGRPLMGTVYLLPDYDEEAYGLGALRGIKADELHALIVAKLENFDVAGFVSKAAANFDNELIHVVAAPEHRPHSE